MIWFIIIILIIFFLVRGNSNTGEDNKNYRENVQKAEINVDRNLQKPRISTDQHYIFKIRDWLEKNGKRYQGFQTKLISLRKSGHDFSTEEHIKGIIYSLLSSQTVWARIEIHLQEIDALFYDYNVEKILNTPQEYFYNGLVNLGCNSRFRKRQMDSLHQIVLKILAIERQYDSLDEFVLSDTPQNLAKKLGDSNSRYKLPQIGETLAYEYLRNVGIDCCKPDVHITRFFGNDRMGNRTCSPATIPETMRYIDDIAYKTGLSKYEIDNVIWSFCAEEYGEVCTANPKCVLCPIKDDCKKGRMISNQFVVHKSKPLVKNIERETFVIERQYNSKKIVVDTETTGFSNFDEILQISIIDIDGKTVLNTYCKPVFHRSWTSAQRVNHISPAMVVNEKTFKEILPAVKTILENADVIIGYNTCFDIRMFENNFINNGSHVKIKAKIVDVMTLYRNKYGTPSKLIDCANHYHYNFMAHDSLEDCRATLYCYKKMCNENENGQ